MKNQYDPHIDKTKIEEWNRNAGFYLPDGTYRPKVNPDTGHIIVPKAIWDMWE